MDFNGSQSLPSHSIWPHSRLCLKAVVQPETRRGQCCCGRPSLSWPPPPEQDLQGRSTAEGWNTFKTCADKQQKENTHPKHSQLSFSTVFLLVNNPFQFKMQFFSKNIITIIFPTLFHHRLLLFQSNSILIVTFFKYNIASWVENINCNHLVN